MVFKDGGNTHHINDKAVSEMSYEDLERVFKGKLDYKLLAEKLGKKPASKFSLKKAVVEDKEEEKA